MKRNQGSRHPALSTTLALAASLRRKPRIRRDWLGKLDQFAVTVLREGRLVQPGECLAGGEMGPRPPERLPWPAWIPGRGRPRPLLWPGTSPARPWESGRRRRPRPLVAASLRSASDRRLSARRRSSRATLRPPHRLLELTGADHQQRLLGELDARGSREAPNLLVGCAPSAVAPVHVVGVGLLEAPHEALRGGLDQPVPSAFRQEPLVELRGRRSRCGDPHLAGPSLPVPHPARQTKQ